MAKKSPSASADKPVATNDETEGNTAEAAPKSTEHAPAENLIQVEGILDIDKKRGGNGQLLDMSKCGKRRPTDVFVPKELIRRFKLQAGSSIGGTIWRSACWKIIPSVM